LGRRVAGEELWQAADDLLDKKRPGDFNQAMMELGATVCRPRAPACLMCPVIERCVTRGELRGGVKAQQQRKREIHFALDYRNGGRRREVFLVRRTMDASLMPGMWELPETTGENGGRAPLCSLRHSITTTDYTVRVWRSTAPVEVQGEWVGLERLPRVALTGLARKILRKAEGILTDH
jgi:A/G-specific adenine glycosylase